MWPQKWQYSSPFEYLPNLCKAICFNTVKSFNFLTKYDIGCFKIPGCPNCGHCKTRCFQKLVFSLWQKRVLLTTFSSSKSKVFQWKQLVDIFFILVEETVIGCFLITLSVRTIKFNCRNFTFLWKLLLNRCKDHSFRGKVKPYMISSLNGGKVWINIEWSWHFV